MKIAIIGAGNIGTAMKTILENTSSEISMWDITMENPPSFESVIEGSEVVFLCIPSWANREVSSKISTLSHDKKRIVITLSKGAEEKTQKTMDQVLHEELGDNSSYGILAGPMLAKEIVKSKFSAATLALSNMEWEEPLTDLFKNTSLHTTFSPDLRGVAVCSIMKNVYSVGLGIFDALDYGANAKGFFTAQAHVETQAILTELGAQRETVETPAGLADFLATGWSGMSYNYKVGKEIISEGEKCPKSEGCIALPSVVKLLGENINKFPLLLTLKNIILDQKDAKKSFETLL